MSNSCLVELRRLASLFDRLYWSRKCFLRVDGKTRCTISVTNVSLFHDARTLPRKLPPARPQKLSNSSVHLHSRVSCIWISPRTPFHSTWISLFLKRACVQSVSSNGRYLRKMENWISWDWKSLRKILFLSCWGFCPSFDNYWKVLFQYWITNWKREMVEVVHLIRYQVVY